MPEAQSAISFALPLNRDLIRPYLNKEPNSRLNHEVDRFDVNVKSYAISKEVAELLRKKGFKAFPVMPNFKFRPNKRGMPDISLRYLAVRGGVGTYGWSGNLGLKGYGPQIVLGGIVTSVKLEPTDPLPESESFCNRCKICANVCAFRMFDAEEEVKIKIGGHEFTHSKRIDKRRCGMICSGLSGLEIEGKWSTWSAGRYKRPENVQDMNKLLMRAFKNSFKLPKREDFKLYDFGEIKPPRDIFFTCGNCQIVCWGDPKQTKENYRLLINSGCVVQKEDGSIEILEPKEAEKLFNAMDPKHKKLYQ